jgi:hypothetical protein
MLRRLALIEFMIPKYDGTVIAIDSASVEAMMIAKAVVQKRDKVLRDQRPAMSAFIERHPNEVQVLWNIQTKAKELVGPRFTPAKFLQEVPVILRQCKANLRFSIQDK